MNAHAFTATFSEPRVDVLDAFTERAGARAFLWAVGEFEMAEAVDRLQLDAQRDGLVQRIGQDSVQTILAREFIAVAATRHEEMES